MSTFNYESILENTTAKIRSIRDTYLNSEISLSDEAKIAFASRLFNFDSQSSAEYRFVVKEIENCVSHAIVEAIHGLFMFYKPCNVSFTVNLDGKDFPICSIFDDSKGHPIAAFICEQYDLRTLYLIKKFGLNYCLPNSVLKKACALLHVSDFQYISLVEDNAFAEILNYDKDNVDGCFGTKRASIKQFIEKYFGSEEYIAFKFFADNLTNTIKEYTGFLIVQQMSPNALFNFKKKIKHELFNCDFEEKIKAITGCKELDLTKVRDQFFIKGYYKSVFSEAVFAESFRTAEWLYFSLPNAGNVDLTSIVLGYFKFVEQLLFSYVSYISSWSDKTRKIDTFKRNKDFEKIPVEYWNWQSVLSEKTINSKRQYIMLDSLINFMTENKDLYRADIDSNIVDAYCNILRNAQKLRNGYLHKDNLKDRTIVLQARDNAFTVLLLTLGIIELKFPDNNNCLHIPLKNDNFEDLYGFIDSHLHSYIYYFTYNDNLVAAVGQPSDSVKFDASGKVVLSEVVFNVLYDVPVQDCVVSVFDVSCCTKQIVSFSSENVPMQISVGYMIPCANGMKFTGPKFLIWDEGAFLDLDISNII